MKPRIGITLGDQNGIGPEIVLKGLVSGAIGRVCSPVVIGQLDVAVWHAQRLRLKVHFKEVDGIPERLQPGVIHVVGIRQEYVPSLRPGTISAEAGAFAGEAIATAARLCLGGKLDAMVTAPVSKSAMHLAGYPFPGQTEMLAELSRTKKPLMILITGTLRVCLATIHIPIKTVSRLITMSRLREVLSIFEASLRTDFGIKRPSIAVLGLNPHAGEDGHIGTEEQKIIRPVIQSYIRKGWDIIGPVAADGFFGTHAHRNCDGIVAMYHDQGLIPLKMEGFASGVNFTAGLPLVRTSPDHGTAFGIAGRGKADPGSLIEAVRLAAEIAVRRRMRRAR